MRLESVVPWGRSLTEYSGMFALSEEDLRSGVLDCGGGPASFAAETAERGFDVVSCDPLYAFDAEQIAARIAETYDIVLAGVEASRDRYCWDSIGSPSRLGEVRMAAMRAFLQDYPEGRRAGRYVASGLPALPFAAERFGLALCSHFLFTYSAHFSTAFHVASVREMCRVAREARIFPLLDLGGNPSPHLGPLLAALRRLGYEAVTERVPYEFQIGGNQMLRVRW
ncbi:MAG: SAM-dependent methyltransferase [Chloroflexota bacterium]|nr:SAM-dependent methyltransferase [Chloroflexota bacterium]